ncbi:hypothetical protein Mal4_56930 [Maioricimonas rarisocia]|uniref:Uncharacterized protein n=1 Tax=Maioricimonas rarisocia TaxID=2528026 RepID=A0A517ZFR3_9PLAN|nr:hypothetical protein [Maioricimonas rarisocia]QDU41327.1 hypothetical protein Mal4_56930 [Maioricimonas rarisocia]
MSTIRDAENAPPTDDIIEEIRRVRTAHAASLGNDLKRIVEDLQRQEQESGAVVVTRPARKTLDQS